MDTLTNRTKVPILVGPTGVGKSELAYRFALQEGFEIISADAFQVFKGMTIGTAQPTSEFLKKVPHHLVGVRDPKKAWNAVRFAEEASHILEAGQKAGKQFLLVGGAGFYLRALVEGPPEGSLPSPEVREMVIEKIREIGEDKAHAWLAERDKAAAERLNPNDLRRICRALEKTFSDPLKVEASYKPLGEKAVVFIGVERSREKLDQLLKKRTELIWQEGLLEETRLLEKLGLDPDHPVLAAIGYAEAAAYLRHEITQEAALERIYRRTRQYAKRQSTWFKHQHEVEWLNLDELSMNEAVLKLREKIL
jgi:tRNA dimethylallyltransferase